MRIADLKNKSVTTAKVNFGRAKESLTFTPSDGSGQARSKCEATVNRRLNNGLVVEYIAKNMPKPNPGFETRPEYIAEREARGALAGRLIAVHEIQHSALPTSQIMGAEAYERMQDMWAEGERRWRWSVAFPIVKTYEIIDRPFAEDVLGDEAYRDIFARLGGMLRDLPDSARKAIAQLEIRELPSVPNAWIDRDAKLQRELRTESMNLIEQDLLDAGMLEGDKKQRQIEAAKRSSAAEAYAAKRANSMFCDECGDDLAGRIAACGIKPRSVFQVHHMVPLAEGPRLSRPTDEDFCLLCPTCHVVMHAHARTLADPAQRRAALRPRARNDKAAAAE
jgi:5-methylcytosine-specific restriction protein A